MAAIYRHTQLGIVMFCALGSVIAAATGLSVRGANPVPRALLLLVGALLVMFSTLTVAVEDQVLRLAFGPGLIGKRIPLGSIRAVRVVRNPWYYGWGIRLTPSGWLWNVSGSGGVELQLTGGARFRVGTDEPEKLASVLRDAIQVV